MGTLCNIRDLFGPDTLSQFLTEYAGNFVILRCYEHGRPVSRSESDLQGPNLGGRVPTENFRCKSLFALGSIWNCHSFKDDARGTEIEQGFTRLRRSASKARRPNVTQPIAKSLRDRSVENRVPTVFTCYLQLRAVCRSLAPANIGLSFLLSRHAVRWDVSIL